MGRQSIRSVAILGGGPSGASLATTLARAGVKVAIFATGERPPIIVGESLVPAIVPYIRKLGAGVEEEVASYSQWKGGATFVLDAKERMSIRFTEARGAKTTYSYNVPRDRFDATVLQAAVRAGALLATGSSYGVSLLSSRLLTGLLRHNWSTCYVRVSRY